MRNDNTIATDTKTATRRCARGCTQPCCGRRQQQYTGKAFSVAVTRDTARVLHYMRIARELHRVSVMEAATSIATAFANRPRHKACEIRESLAWRSVSRTHANALRAELMRIFAEHARHKQPPAAFHGYRALRSVLALPADVATHVCTADLWRVVFTTADCEMDEHTRNDYDLLLAVCATVGPDACNMPHAMFGMHVAPHHALQHLKAPQVAAAIAHAWHLHPTAIDR